MEREALLRLLRDREVVLAIAEALASVPEAAGALLRAAGPEAAVELLRKAAESPEAVKAFTQLLSRPEVAKAVASAPEALKAMAEAVGRDPEAAARLASAVASHIAVPLNVATREDLKAIAERMATREDVKALADRVAAVEAAVEDIKASMVTREEFQKAVENLATKEDLQSLATKEDVRLLGVKIDGLGARWGLAAEEAFRAGVRELLREAGYTVERWTYYDGEGYVFGFGSEVDLDVVVRDGRVFVVEVKSALERENLQTLRRKAELYERVTGRRVDGIYAVTAFIRDRRPEEVRRRAEELGINVVAPEELEGGRP